MKLESTEILNSAFRYMLLEILEEEREALLSSCIHGYHAYKDIWTLVIGKELTCIIEAEMSAVTVQYGDSAVVGHLPQALSRIRSLFSLRCSRGTHL